MPTRRWRSAWPTTARSMPIRSTPARPAGRPGRGAELIPGRASYYVRGLTPIAKVVQRGRGNVRIAPAAAMPGAATAPSPSGRGERPSADGGRRARRTRYASTPMDHRSHRCPDCPLSEAEISADQVLPRAAPAPAADDPVASSCRSSCSSCSRAACPASTWTSCRARSWPPTRCCCSPPSPIFYARLPAARPALGDPDPGDRLPARRSATRPRSSSSRGWSTASCRPSSATSTGPTCCKHQRRGLAEPDLRDGLHRADPRPVRDRRPGPGRRLRRASAAGCRPTSRSSSRSASWSWSSCSSLVLFACATSAGGILTRLPLPAARHRALRPVRGGRLLGRRLGARCRSSLILTGLIWSTEALRLLLRGRRPSASPTSTSGISGAFFVALTGSLLTAVPFTPAGLGIVEAGIVGVLTAGLQRAPDRGAHDRPRRPGDQRPVDHRPGQRSPYVGLADAPGHGRSRSRCASAPRRRPALAAPDRPDPAALGTAWRVGRATDRRSGAGRGTCTTGSRPVHRTRTATEPHRTGPHQSATDRARSDPVPTGDTATQRARADSRAVRQRTRSVAQRSAQRAV